MKLRQGTVIADTYRADKRIGVGGMGEVWQGVRLADNAKVALKVLLPDLNDPGEVYARFRREAQVLARVNSPYAAKVLDFVSDSDWLVLVMELIPGPSLHVVLTEFGSLALELVFNLLSDVLQGLRDLHKVGVVHRDLKPGNVVLRPMPGQRPRAVLIDFGVSRIIVSSSEEEVTAITRGDRVLGTIEYMAPEQILGSRTVTGTADLYAAGAMAFRAIAGYHVFGDLQEGKLAVAKLNEDPPPVPTGRVDEIGKRTERFIARLLARRLRNRFESAEQALQELSVLQAMLAAETRSPAQLPRRYAPSMPPMPSALSAPSALSMPSVPSVPSVHRASAIPVEHPSVRSYITMAGFAGTSRRSSYVPAETRVAREISRRSASTASIAASNRASFSHRTDAPPQLLNAAQMATCQSAAAVVPTVPSPKKYLRIPWIVLISTAVGASVGTLTGVSYARKEIGYSVVNAVCSRLGVDHQTVTSQVGLWASQRISYISTVVPLRCSSASRQNSHQRQPPSASQPETKSTVAAEHVASNTANVVTDISTH